jgi:hypothetical protein
MLSALVAFGLLSAISTPSYAIVSSAINKNIYFGNGVTTSFNYTFPILLSTDIQVYTVDINGNVTQQTSNFSVNTVTQSVLYPVSGSPLASGTQIILLRVEPFTQQVAASNQGPSPSPVVMGMSDKLTMISQQLQEQLDRSPLSSVNSSTPLTFPSSSPGLLIGWLANGNLGNIANTSNPWLYSGSNIYYNNGTVSSLNGFIGNVTGNVTAGTITTTGSVGIGTSSPLDILDVRKGTDQRLVVTTASTNGIQLESVNDAGNTFNNLELNGSNLILNSSSGGDVYTNACADYSASSTIVGFSSISVKQIYVCKLGKHVTVYYGIVGTSNANKLSFTLQYNTNTFIGIEKTSGYSMDNSTPITNSLTQVEMSANSNVVNFYKASTGSNWTTSGTKAVYGDFDFQST